MAQAYISKTDIERFGLNGYALEGIPAQTITDTCLAVSEEADAAFRARYNLPLLSWGSDVRACLAKIAAYELLVVRGFNPEVSADQNLAIRAADARAWLRAVARQEMQPNVEPSPPQVPEFDQPRITTSQRLWTSYTRRAIG
jgi:phage gp36-like protein